MEVNELLDRTREVFQAKRVFGEPIQQDGITIIPVAKVNGGGGGGEGGAEGQGTGFGSGFGIAARPAGLYVVRRDGRIHWRPALDVNRIVLGGQLVAMVALLVFARVARAQRRKR